MITAAVVIVGLGLLGFLGKDLISTLVNDESAEVPESRIPAVADLETGEAGVAPPPDRADDTEKPATKIATPGPIELTPTKKIPEPTPTPEARPKPNAETARQSPPSDAVASDTSKGLSAADLLTQADEVLIKRELDWASSLYLAAEEHATTHRNAELKARAGRGLRMVQAYENLFATLARVDPTVVQKAGRIPYRAGKTGKLLTVSNAGISVATRGGPLELKWRLLPAACLRILVRKLRAGPLAVVDAAAILNHAQLAEQANQLLVQAHRKATGPKTRRAIQMVLADARAIPVPDGGFTLFKGTWVTPRELARSKLTAAVLAARKDLTADDPATREAAFTVLRDLGESARSSLNRGILVARVVLVEKLQKHKSFGPLMKLAGARKELDQHRAFALELIMDTIKYPYPYSKGKGATAEAIQNFRTHAPIVAKRCRVVKEAWESDTLVTPGKGFKEIVVRLQETDRWLYVAGFDPVADEYTWALHLPTEGAVSLRLFATSAQDRIRIDESEKIMILNRDQPGEARRGEQEQARITNEYRILFGRHAVRLYDPLVRASRGHCQDMVKLGFFSHFSKVPGKRTPYDRVRKEGMKPLGASENIAMAGGAMGAHNGWVGSSGHHRNILGQGWRIMGPGNAGSRWCQLFSAGDANAKKSDADGDGEQDSEGNR